MDNPLAIAAPPPQTMQLDPQAVSKSFGMAKGLFDQTSQAMKNISIVEQQLTKLSKLGDLVTPEEVIKSAGELVASGVQSANEAATLLADMPQGGQALGAWVADHASKLQENLQMVSGLHSTARHEMGASSLRMLQAHAGPETHVDRAMPQASSTTGDPAMGEAPPAVGNPLMPAIGGGEK